MKTTYRLVPVSDLKPRVLETMEELQAAAKALRKQNKGYCMYMLITEANSRPKVQLLPGWMPKV